MTGGSKQAMACCTAAQLSQTGQDVPHLTEPLKALKISSNKPREYHCMLVLFCLKDSATTNVNSALPLPCEPVCKLF